MMRALMVSCGAALVAVSLLLSGFAGLQAWKETQSAPNAADASQEATGDVAEPRVEVFTRPVSSQRQVLSAESSEGISVSTDSSAPEFGDAFGYLYVPRLRDKAWAQPILSGVEDEQLNSGIGHFRYSVMPGEVGNFAIAGHRATHGQPFADIDQLESGDEVIIRTNTNWFVYTLTEDRIVKPEDVWVVDPVPGEIAEVPSRALLTIVTCEPRWGSSSRWIWWGELKETLSISQTPDSMVRLGQNRL